MRQRKRTVAARHFARAAGIKQDNVEIAVGERQRQCRADRAGADNDYIMQHLFRRPRERGDPVFFP